MTATVSPQLPRLRFSPSPTGYFHVGGARTALYNWLIARQGGGTFILRIEDTDASRNQPEWVTGIETAMTWLGLDWDEGPYFQSARADRHAEAAAQLRDAGLTYYCDCTADVVKERTKGSATPGYDGFCRDRGLTAGPGRALRFRVPDGGSTVVHDLIRGDPEFAHDTIADFVIARADGSALFVLANVVDDIDMGITLVLRGEEHLPTTPKYILLHQALEPDRALPAFAHLPVLVDEQRKKLSKRKHRVALEDFRDQGILPEAMRNYLALLGWAPGNDRELLSLDELVAEFRVEDVVPSSAFFDERKLRYFNGEYLKALPLDRFVADATPFLDAWSEEAKVDVDPAVFTAIAPLVQERVKTLAEVPSMVDFLFLDEPDVDDRAWDKRVVRGPHAAEILDAALVDYTAMADWEADALAAATEAIGQRFELGLAKAQFPIRVAVTGRDVGPPLWESLVLLGRDRVLDRLRSARQRLGE